MKSSSWASASAVALCAVAVTTAEVTGVLAVTGTPGVSHDRAASPQVATGLLKPAHAARASCRGALPGRRVISADATTVQAARSWGYLGPIQRHPLRGAFPGAPGQDPALWCWTRDGNGRVSAYAVHRGDDAAFAITIVGPAHATPRGSPRVP